MNIQVQPDELAQSVDYSKHLGCDTMSALFRHQCTRYGKRTAHREKDLGIWNAFTWEDYYNNARLIGLAMLSLGLKRGDVISILSEDVKEWLVLRYGSNLV